MASSGWKEKGKGCSCPQRGWHLIHPALGVDWGVNPQLDFQEGETPQVSGLLLQDVAVPEIIQKFSLVFDHILSSCLTCQECKFKGSDEGRECGNAALLLFSVLSLPQNSPYPHPTTHCGHMGTREN